jgi:hypothetical protein
LRNTFEWAEVVSVQGPSVTPGASRSFSTTKNVPSGVGVDGLPTTTRKLARTLPSPRTKARRCKRWTSISQFVDVIDPTLARTQPVDPFGRVGSLTRSQRAQVPSLLE